ncbi:unnamed protein product [Macrosiphum euphorbiae]|uniref:RNA-directed DNA polymerase n=1 Tax=Macrosiphum euphorbiae TaxID=13131 RepID=A0AAV0WE58_9HEMI|nr:unnamed protein product [Macrosiphum euphorbiae]
MSFTRKHVVINWSYSLNNSVISRVEMIVDLGFKVNSSLDPGPHINMICCKAYKMLGFLKRLAHDFKLGLSLKIIFCSLVRPILEYGAVLWNPHTAGHSRQLCILQRKFLSFAGFILNIHHQPVSEFLNIDTYSNRRITLGFKFLNGLISGNIDSPYLLSLINFRVPQRISRNNAPFYIPSYTSNYLANEPITRLMSLANVDASRLC